MPDSKRTRILLLILAGALLIGGVNVWQNAQIAKQEEITDRPIKAKRTKIKKMAVVAVKPPSPEFKVGMAEPVRQPGNTMPQPTIPPTTTMTGTNQTPMPAVPAQAQEPTKIAATGRVDAEVVARKGAGRKDPFIGITGLKPFPSHGASLDEETPTAPIKSKRMLVPPPPPVVHTYAPPVLASDQIPEPPSRPMLSHKVRLVAVLADRAVLKITDGRLRADNKWPPTITLGSGEKFESLEVVRVAPDSVTIEEDGERSVKTLERIR
ncbi:MAG: hypothetical protein K2Y22_17395 [Candidatus Obscuribacterales bacterium]|nr:hypothetical protein [Candidatus Obscuribacterales bacterium]